MHAVVCSVVTLCRQADEAVVVWLLVQGNHKQTKFGHMLQPTDSRKVTTEMPEHPVGKH